MRMSPSEPIVVRELVGCAHAVRGRPFRVGHAAAARHCAGRCAFPDFGGVGSDGTPLRVEGVTAAVGCGVIMCEFIAGKCGLYCPAVGGSECCGEPAFGGNRHSRRGDDGACGEGHDCSFHLQSVLWHPMPHKPPHRYGKSKNKPCKYQQPSAYSCIFYLCQAKTCSHKLEGNQYCGHVYRSAIFFCIPGVIGVGRQGENGRGVSPETGARRVVLCDGPEVPAVAPQVMISRGEDRRLREPCQPRCSRTS